MSFLATGASLRDDFMLNVLLFKKRKPAMLLRNSGSRITSRGAVNDKRAPGFPRDAT